MKSKSTTYCRGTTYINEVCPMGKGVRVIKAGFTGPADYSEKMQLIHVGENHQGREAKYQINGVPVFGVSIPKDPFVSYTMNAPWSGFVKAGFGYICIEVLDDYEYRIPVGQKATIPANNVGKFTKGSPVPINIMNTKPLGLADNEIDVSEYLVPHDLPFESGWAVFPNGFGSKKGTLTEYCQYLKTLCNSKATYEQKANGLCNAWEPTEKAKFGTKSFGSGQIAPKFSEQMEHSLLRGSNTDEHHHYNRHIYDHDMDVMGDQMPA